MPPFEPVGRQLQDSRLVSLDVFRGLTVAGMILVTDPGTYSAIYWPLRHAEWHGATPTDMISPSFLFIVGVAITFSFAARLERGFDRGWLALHLLFRSAVLFIVGLALNGFPVYDWTNLRIPGILQKIAVCYLFGGLIYLVCDRVGNMPRGHTTDSRRWGNWIILSAVFAILGGYWALLKLFPVPGFGPGGLDTRGTLSAYVDRVAFGIPHLWAYGTTPGYGMTYDPDGIFATLPAISAVLIGVLAGEWMRTERSGVRKASGLLGMGLILLIAGWLLHPLLPFNKKIWTSTYAIFSGGVSLIVFALLYAIVDLKRWRGWTSFALVFGTNAILAFAVSTLITTLADRLHPSMANGSHLSLHHWVYQYGFASWMLPIHASLAYAIAIVLLNAAILWPLYRRRIFLKI